MSAASRDRKFEYFIYTLCLCSFVFIIYFVITLNKPNQYNPYNQYNQYRKAFIHQKEPENALQPRTILLWNHMFNFSRWGLPKDILGPDYFRDQKCSFANCILTLKRDLLPSVEMYDALVFHLAEKDPLYPPKTRSPAQQYVFAIKEPPGETRHMLGDHGGGFFNLTMTYRLDSDILWPYALVEDIESGGVIAPALSPSWRKVPMEYHDEEVDRLVAGKTKLVAWFVSHCVTLSNRERVAKMLGKYVDVDIFGACGPFKCPYSSPECDNMLNKDYKFYLSFENSLCLDYVTEKFYEALQRQIVPIVFGGANYTRFAPPHSYINADDFPNVKELGNYLIYLHTHPKEYARYFWWRKHYRVTYKKIFKQFCDLCEKLHEPTKEKKVQFYADIENWWFLKKSCYFKPKISHAS